ncbi:protein phosphatase 1 regulatory subunit 1B-like isoform X2 [Brienomyrus brachyistius]|uniref:protein phosphatase 1 regulatory subunit 1B-like isoform X2 n=1 Tax=Brienomyrus brachyistius TaxID=42636 RepID=UPI0020B1A705|nr:protein phosphatase 1 regulatory subunit 1B-like isoform X2 [Brienomyrus brachyistius]
MEPNNPKKIQFAVPPHQKQLDPQAAEQIRRRRPTPASLMVYANPEAGDTGDKRETGYLGEVPSSELSRAQRKHGVYTAPTMRGTALTTTSSTSLIVGSGRRIVPGDRRSQTTSTLTGWVRRTAQGACRGPAQVQRHAISAPSSCSHRRKAAEDRYQAVLPGRRGR